MTFETIPSKAAVSAELIWILATASGEMMVTASGDDTTQYINQAKQFGSREDAETAAPEIALALGRRFGGRWPIHVDLQAFGEWRVKLADGSTIYPVRMGVDWTPEQVMRVFSGRYPMYPRD